MPKKKDKEILLLVDGNALIHRGFHAIPHLSAKSGEPTNGVYGFAMLFLNALKEIGPEYVVVTFDPPGPTFRDEIYDEYKSTREKAPQELYDQIPKVKELVEAFNVPIFEKEGFEADDAIGTLASQADKQGLETVILTGDFDTLQLVNKNIKVFAPKKGLSETQLFDKRDVVKKYGIEPEQMIDYKALRGDPSDNIPGVKGVGEKTAADLLQEFRDLDSIYKYLDDNPDGGERIKKRPASLLLEHKDDAYLSRELATIKRDMPIEFEIKKAELKDYDESEVVKLFQELEFKTLLSKLPEAGSGNSTEDSMSENDEYKYIENKKQLQVFLEELKKQKEIIIDTETTSERAMEAELVGVGIGWESGKTAYLPEKYLEELREVLEDKKIKKTGHNIKYDYLVLKNSGVNMAGVSFDTMIAAYLLNPGARSFSLDTLAFSELGHRMQPIEELIGKKGKSQITMKEVDAEKVALYCGEDVDYTLQLKEKLEPELKEKDLDKIFQDIELPLVSVLGDMEYFGIKLDPKVLEELGDRAKKEIEKIEKQVFEYAGEEFNVGSPVQLKEVLFEKLDIPTEGIKRGKTGYSTAATELEKLRGQHPIIDLISEWRELTKLQNTYIETLPDLINKDTGRIHTSFNQTIAATGRLSSSDPNLQNIPVRTELGRKIRGAFVAEKDYQLVSIDYSQIELRLAAHLSGDKKMLKVFKEGGDIHEATAEEIGVDRRKAKVINFGILYGLSAHGFVQRIPEVSREEAAKFIEQYKQAYPRLVEYLDEVVEETRDKGYVKNELGRIRNLPEINSSQFQVRSAAERAAINMPLQSMAADIIKMAMNKLAEKKLTTKEDCRLLLQVHDELVFEIKKDKIEDYTMEIKKIMQDIYSLQVPLLVEVKTGSNWEEMKDINF